MCSHLRRTLLALLVVSIALTPACGKPRRASVPGVKKSREPAGIVKPKVPLSPDAITIGDARIPYQAYGSDALSGEFPRTVRHAMGETTIAAKPTRVVALGLAELDSALQLGLTPVGTTDFGAEGMPPYLDAKTVDGIARVGTAEAPDLAAIAALKPDLILSNRVAHEALYAPLSLIAPTVFGGHAEVAWQLNFLLVAAALGREREADDTIERYRQRVAAVAESLPQPRPTVSFVAVLPETLRIYQRANFVALLLSDLGVARPRYQDFDESTIDTTLDNVNNADAHVIFVAIGPQGKASYDKLAASAPWKALKAVKAGRVRKIDYQTWAQGHGYRAAFAILDQLVDLFKDDHLRT